MKSVIKWTPHAPRVCQVIMGKHVKKHVGIVSTIHVRMILASVPLDANLIISRINAMSNARTTAKTTHVIVVMVSVF